MLFRRKRDLTGEFRKIFEEGAEIENSFFEPVAKVLAEKLQEAGLPRSQRRQALKAGLNAAKQKHVDMNLAALGFFALDLNTRGHLRRALPLSQRCQNMRVSLPRIDERNRPRWNDLCNSANLSADG